MQKKQAILNKTKNAPPSLKVRMNAWSMRTRIWIKVAVFQTKQKKCCCKRIKYNKMKKEKKNYNQELMNMLNK